MKLSFLTDNLGFKILALLLAIVIYYMLRPDEAKSGDLGTKNARPAISLQQAEKALQGHQGSKTP